MAQADEHVATGRKNIARQRAVLAELERDGHDKPTVQVQMDTRGYENFKTMVPIAGRGCARLLLPPAPAHFFRRSLPPSYRRRRTT